MFWAIIQVLGGNFHAMEDIDQSKNQSIKNVFHINYNQVQHIHAIKGVMWKGES